MKSVYSTIALCLFSVAMGFCQYEQVYKDYDWASDPVITPLDSSYAEEDEVLIKKAFYREFTLTTTGLEQINTLHTVTKVHSDLGIEQNNKIYLSVNEASSVLIQKARVIKPNGDVIDLKESDIQEAEDDNGNKTRYFALEGLEIDSEVEYFYKTKTPASLNGAFVYAQSGMPMLEFDFKLVHPKWLIMETQLYNMTDSLSTDSVNEYYDEISLKSLNVEKLKSEEVAFYEPHLKKIAYKLKHNLSSGAKDIVSYGTESIKFYESLMSPAEKKDLKILKSFIKDAEIEDITDTEEKIRKLERHIKDYIQYGNSYITDELIYKTADEARFSSKRGLTMIFANAFTYLDIDFELVLTCDRSEHPFDEEFQSYMSMAEFLIYFPELGKYMAPTQAFSCLGIVPAMWTANKGLFIQELNLGGMTTGLGKIKDIATPEASLSKDVMTITCALDLDELTSDIALERESHGYYAMGIQPLFPYLDDETREEISEGMAQFISDDLEVENVEVINIEAEDFGVKPLIVKATSTTDILLSTAGDKTLFNLGQLIGTQAEMYNEEEEERKLPVEEEFTRFYVRDITLEIPEDYALQNPEDMNMDVKHERDGEIISAFTSTYEVNGNSIVLHCEEYYNEVDMPKEEFQAYRNVVNAAADFNKIVLIFKAK